MKLFKRKKQKNTVDHIDTLIDLDALNEDERFFDKILFGVALIGIQAFGLGFLLGFIIFVLWK